MIVKNIKIFIVLIIFKFEVSSAVKAMVSGEEWIRRKRQLPFDNELNSVCPRLESPPLGWMNCTQTNNRRECSGGCLPGYAFEDGRTQMNLRCRQDGIWRPQSYFPPCMSMSQCELEHLGGSSFNCTVGMRGTRCDIACNGQYEGRYRCYPGREWRPPLPRCVTANAVCAEPVILGGSSFNCTTGMDGTECDIICDGFYEGRYHCYPGLEWSPPLPPCVRATSNVLYCEEPQVPENGRTLYRNLTSRYPLGSELRYACNEGYEMLGSDRIYCSTSGQWSTPPPLCRSTIFCAEPDVPENGKVLFRSGISHSSGSEMRYVCVEGYEMTGEDRITCLKTGQWSSPPPLCRLPAIVSEEKKVPECDDPGPISNGRFQVLPPLRGPLEYYPEGSRLKYSCESPYVLRGNETITCRSTELWSLDPPTCVEDCGRSLQHTSYRIHHGNRTVAGEWPWTVAISREGGSLVCSGVLMNRRTILTAAHCIDSNVRYTLRFGKFHFRNSLDDDQVMNSRSTQLIVHPSYNATTHAYDIALIKFSPRVRYTDRIQPICLPTRSTTTFDLRPGRYGYVTGWGQTETGRQPDELLMAYLPVQTAEKCMASLGSSRILAGMFCAGLDRGTKSKDETASACTGDSGSGLVFYDEHSHQYTVEGIVSFGVPGQCGVPGKYTVFTKVSDYIRWILRNAR